MSDEAKVECSACGARFRMPPSDSTARTRRFRCTKCNTVNEYQPCSTVPSPPAAKVQETPIEATPKPPFEDGAPAPPSIVESGRQLSKRKLFLGVACVLTSIMTVAALALWQRGASDDSSIASETEEQASVAENGDAGTEQVDVGTTGDEGDSESESSASRPVVKSDLAYLHLASAATFSYVVDHERFNGNPSILAVALGSAKNTKDPNIRRAVEGLTRYLTKLVEAGVVQAQANARVVEGGVVVAQEGLGGPTLEFTETEEGSGRFVETTGKRFGEGLGNLFVGMAKDQQARAMRSAADSDRRDAWESLYPAAKSLAVGPPTWSKNEFDVILNYVPKEWDSRSVAGAFGSAFAPSDTTMPAILFRHTSPVPIERATLKVSVTNLFGETTDSYHLIGRWSKESTFSPRLGLDWRSDQMERVCYLQWELSPIGAASVQGEAIFPEFVEAHLRRMLERGDYANTQKESQSLLKLFATTSSLAQKGTELLSDAMAMRERHDHLVAFLESNSSYSGDWTFGKFHAPLSFDIRSSLPNPLQKNVIHARLRLSAPESPQLYAEGNLQLNFIPVLKNYVIEFTGEQATLLKDEPDKVPTIMEMMSNRGRDHKYWKFWPDSPDGLIGITARGAVLRVFPPNTETIRPLGYDELSQLQLIDVPEFAPVPLEYLPSNPQAKRWSITHGEGELWRTSVLPLQLGSEAYSDLNHRDGRVNFAVFSPQGQTFFTNHNLGDWLHVPDLTVWDPVSRGLATGFKPLNIEGEIVAASPDRTFVARRLHFYDGPREGKWIDFVDLKTGRELKNTSPIKVGGVHSVNIESAVISRDNSMIAGADDTFLRIWQVKNKNGANLLHGIRHTSKVVRVAFEGTGGFVICSLSDGTVNTYDILNGRLVKTIALEQRYRNGTTIAADLCTLSGWNKVLVRTVAINGNGTHGSQSRLELFSPESDRPVWTTDLPLHNRGIALSGTGRRLVVLSDPVNVVYDLPTGLPILRLTGHNNAISSVDFSDDGRFLLTGESRSWPWAVVWGVPEDSTVQYLE